MILAVVTALIFICICLTIHAKAIHSTTRLLIVKPLTMGLILFIVVVYGYCRADLYFYMILCGLLFSLTGDIFLIFPRKHFLKGLIGFLIAHLFYIAAFSSGKPLTFNLWIPLLLLIYGSVIFLILRPNLNKMAEAGTVFHNAVEPNIKCISEDQLIDTNSGHNDDCMTSPVG